MDKTYGPRNLPDGRQTLRTRNAGRLPVRRLREWPIAGAQATMIEDQIIGEGKRYVRFSTTYVDERGVQVTRVADAYEEAEQPGVVAMLVEMARRRHAGPRPLLPIRRAG